jgi:hypothetical protein
MLFAHSRDVVNCKAVKCDAQKETLVVTCSADMVIRPALAAPIWSYGPHFLDANDKLLRVTKLHLDVSAVHG